jgi:hypothetical protein
VVSFSSRKMRPKLRMELTALRAAAYPLGGMEELVKL